MMTKARLASVIVLAALAAYVIFGAGLIVTTWHWTSQERACAFGHPKLWHPWGCP
jgi:hypothetical protein